MTELESFLRFLGSRYESARDDLDQVRVRAMELVVAATLTELHRNPPIVAQRVREDPDATSEFDIESYLREEDDWEEDPVPVRRPPAPPPPPPPSPEPVQERVPERESAAEPLSEATNWSSTPPATDEPPPPEPVRGAWEAPRD